VDQSPVATVIIVNYRGRGRVGRCLDAIAAARSELPYEVLVVDNASDDGSWDEAAGRPGVRLIRNDGNVGFGRACNQAAREARGRHLVFLNFDCEPQAGWLDALVRAADDDPTAGAVQAVILHRDGSVNTAGNVQHYLGFSWAPHGPVAPDGPPFEVTVGSGAGLLVPRARFEQVGGFWEAMFLYCEDTDLSWRLRLSGYRVLAAPGAHVLHEYEFGRNIDKYFHLERNRLLMVAANYEARTLLALVPGLLATELALVAVALRGGWGRRKLEADIAALAAWRELRAQRRRVAVLRRVPDREVAARFARRLGPEFGEGVARASAGLLAAYARLARLP
jgi:GT2 family glycosyltransferase